MPPCFKDCSGSSRAASEETAELEVVHVAERADRFDVGLGHARKISDRALDALCPPQGSTGRWASYGGLTVDRWTGGGSGVLDMIPGAGTTIVANQRVNLFRHENSKVPLLRRSPPCVGSCGLERLRLGVHRLSRRDRERHPPPIGVSAQCVGDLTVDRRLTGAVPGVAQLGGVTSASWAARASSSRWSGWAMSMRALVRSPMVRPRSSATPYSVTTLSTVFLSVVTAAPGDRRGTMRENDLSLVVEWTRRIPDPRGSAWRLWRSPPFTAAGRVATVDDLRVGLARKSTSRVELIDTNFGSRPITADR